MSYYQIMKNIKALSIIPLISLALLFVQCQDDDDNGNAIYQDMCSDGVKNGDETGIDCGGSCEPCAEEELFAGRYKQEDQMGRPGVNLLLNKPGLRDSLNLVVPHKMQSQFKDVFRDRLMTLDTSYTTNILGLNADQMAEMFSQDVLWVAENGETSYNGTQILTGRALGEDVMDANLLWIFGGPDGTKNNEDPNLISDGVPENDAPFLNTFPYLAPPF